MYVIIRNSDKTAHIFKDKTAAADFVGVSPYIFSKVLGGEYDFGGKYYAYKATTFKNKSSRGGYRPPKI